MKVSSIASIGVGNVLHPKKEKIEKPNDANNKSVSMSDMTYFPLMFKGSKKTSTYTVDYKIAEEIALSGIARNNGVHTPSISDKNTYEIKGKIADYEENPVDFEQIENTISDIFLMDEAGVIHGDLEKGHIFYKKEDKKPEFDFFRFGYEYQKDEGRASWDFPKDIYPANIFQYEGNWISSYMSKMPEEEKENFLKKYLILSADYHKKRAELLSTKEDASDKQIEFEKSYANARKVPTKDALELFRDRINVQYLERLAFTEWDEGGGACGHEKDESRVVKGNTMYFDALRAAVQYVEKIEKKEEETSDKKELEFLQSAKTLGTHLVNNYLSSNIGRAKWSVDLENEDNKLHRGDCTDEKAEFERLYGEMKEAYKERDMKNTYDLINAVQAQYLIMAKKAESKPQD